MRRSWFSAVVFAASFLSLAAGSAKCQGPVSVAVEPHSKGRLVVPVKVNGAGPYPFLIDTGASMTILDAALFRELGIRAQGKVVLASARGEQARELGIVDEIVVSGLSVSPISVVTVDDLDIGSIHVRGVLGENFLSHFDLLIDNQHGRITFDPTDALMEQMVGEKLPVKFDSRVNDQGEKMRPTVAVTLAAYGAAPLNLLLDSAADTIIVRAPKSRHRMAIFNGSEMRVMVHSIFGAVACESWEDELRWGRFHANGVRMTNCGSPGSARLGDEGSLPTSGFQQIFVSHAGGYVVLNPSRRAPVLRETAPQQAADVIAAGTE